mgnify:CR=1 FL=1
MFKGSLGQPKSTNIGPASQHKSSLKNVQISSRTSLNVFCFYQFKTVPICWLYATWLPKSVPTWMTHALFTFLRSIQTQLVNIPRGIQQYSVQKKKRPNIPTTGKSFVRNIQEFLHKWGTKKDTKNNNNNQIQFYLFWWWVAGVVKIKVLFKKQ